MGEDWGMLCKPEGAEWWLAQGQASLGCWDRPRCSIVAEKGVTEYLNPFEWLLRHKSKAC